MNARPTDISAGAQALLAKMQMQKSAQSQAENPPLAPSSPDNYCAENCEICGGMGYIRYDVPLNDPRFGKIYPCPNLPVTSAIYDKTGLTPTERMYTWASVRERTIDAATNDSLQKAIKTVQDVLARKSGLVYLCGGYGLAKSLILKVAIAETIRSRKGIMPRYIYMERMIDVLRGTFDSRSTRGLEEVEAEFALCPVLCIDEFDNLETAWSDRRRFYIIDRRYTRAIENGEEIITIIASNRRVGEISDGRIADRLQDGRAHYVELTGVSARPSMRPPK